MNIFFSFLKSKSTAGKFTTDPGKCVVQFLETNPYVTVGTAIAAFYLPVTIMIVLYSRVYAETEKRRKEFAKLQGGQVLMITLYGDSDCEWAWFKPGNKVETDGFDPRRVLVFVHARVCLYYVYELMKKTFYVCIYSFILDQFNLKVGLIFFKHKWPKASKAAFPKKI